ncbi:MAG TPA: hypothetical protein VLT57_06500, partial [Bryobacteraceae bacterium]|nr:hypothetical protein [Bryobacteraceae bacterium]
EPSRADAHYRLAGVLRALGRTKDADYELARVRELQQKEQDHQKDLLLNANLPRPAAATP